MKTTTILASLALLTTLAAPLPALAQINPPPSPLAEGLPQEALDQLWCSVLFDDESWEFDDLGRADTFDTAADRLYFAARDLLRGQGVTDEHFEELEEEYFWHIVATSAVRPGSLSSNIAACEAAFFPVEAPASTPAPTRPDFDCAVVYWTWGSFVPSDQQAAMERVLFAADRHQQANPRLDMAIIEQQMLAAVQARGQAIQQGAESAEQLQADLAACEAQYGL